MKTLRPYLNVAAALSSLTLAVCFILYRTGRLNFWNSTPKPAEAQAAAPSDATRYEATEGDLALIDRMSGSKSEVPLIKSEPKAGYVFKNINGGDASNKNEPPRKMMSGSKFGAIAEPIREEPAKREFLPGPKSGGMDFDKVVTKKREPTPQQILDEPAISTRESSQYIKPKVPARTVLPGSKAPFPGFINAPENPPAATPAQPEKPQRELLPGSKSRAILDSAADVEKMKEEMNKWLDGKEDKKPAKPTAEENLKNGFKFDYSVNPYQLNTQPPKTNPPPSETKPAAPTPPPAPKRKVMGGPKSAIIVEPENPPA